MTEYHEYPPEADTQAQLYQRLRGYYRYVMDPSDNRLKCKFEVK